MRRKKQPRTNNNDIKLVIIFADVELPTEELVKKQKLVMETLGIPLLICDNKVKTVDIYHDKDKVAYHGLVNETHKDIEEQEIKVEDVVSTKKQKGE